MHPNTFASFNALTLRLQRLEYKKTFLPTLFSYRALLNILSKKHRI